MYPGGLWSGEGAPLLGQGVARAAVCGQPYGASRGRLSLGCKALPD
jgi:hypothetical protein